MQRDRRECAPIIRMESNAISDMPLSSRVTSRPNRAGVNPCHHSTSTVRTLSLRRATGAAMRRRYAPFSSLSNTRLLLDCFQTYCHLLDELTCACFEVSKYSYGILIVAPQAIMAKVAFNIGSGGKSGESPVFLHHESLSLLFLIGQ